MSETAEESKTEGDDVAERSEPRHMSWFVVVFMALCLFMTATLAYYVWVVFERAV